MFEISVQLAVAASVTDNKPMFVYVSDGNNTFLDKYLNHDQNHAQVQAHDSLHNTLKTHFICVKLVRGTPDFISFEQIFPRLICPSFYIVSKGQLLDVITADTEASALPQRLHDAMHITSPSRVSTPANSGLEPAPNQHDETVRQYQHQIAENKKARDAERKRIKALLEADKRERQLSKKNQAHHPNTALPVTIPRNYDSCVLLVRLFDGQSLKGEFKSNQTLNDVRSWLDEETNHSIVPTEESSMPAFAHSFTLQPSKYAFHCAGIPPTTFDDSQEFQTLSDLNLCPRSALILKPIYDEAVFASYPKSRASVFSSIGGAIGKLSNAVYSFFDYGVVDEEDDDISPVNSSQEVTTSGSDDVELHTAKQSESKDGNKTPNILSIGSHRPLSASLINFESLRRTQNQKTKKDDIKLESRPSSPRLEARSRAASPPLGTLCTSRTQTIHNEATLQKDSDRETLSVDRD